MINKFTNEIIVKSCGRQSCNFSMDNNIYLDKYYYVASSI
ncbi:unnamed protein product [Moritella viscosa]|uniref:Uncharacterized protein n=1 Tax=Moritella viscosa TaxID=80854 RepID=A0A1L0CQD8_9GAMM|nr:unnamed protein product [Moritella viscosa]